MQYVRFRPGDTFSGEDGYQPDALSVTGSNIMIDHVSASWSTDEVLSPTDAHNVSVQWSMITEALHDAGHEKGDHGYGSLINGGDFSFHHNLYADNRSRNPKAALSKLDGFITRLDFVNNVMQNPGNRFGYSDDKDIVRLNYVGNYGIDGPDSTADSLYETDFTQTIVYRQGNFRDSNLNGVLDGSATNAISGTYTLTGTRFDLPQVGTTDARQAYIQVLSRAGANYYRDPVDRRVIRNVINQVGAHIDSQNEVGGWPSLPSLSPPSDSNSDGVPDFFASTNGFPIGTNIRNLTAPDGYTWMEKYLHSLTPNAYAPTNTAPMSISTAYGRGGDAWVNENGGTSATSDGNGTGSDLNVRWNDSDRNEYTVLKFDLAQVRPGSIADASLELTAYRNLRGSHQLTVYGLEHDAAGWDWGEDSIEFANAPGLEFDGNSKTRGLAGDKVLKLGTLNASGVSEGNVATFNNANLAVFLNLAAQFQGASQDGLVTLLLERTGADGSRTRFASQEATQLDSGLAAVAAGTYAPRLLLDAIAILSPTLLGDYNQDGQVDAADYVVWRRSFGQSGSGLPADGNGNGTVDYDDHNLWRANFGRSAASAFSASGIIPEPSTLPLAVAALVFIGLRRRFGGRMARRKI
ncbi:MAG: DNRLRE domain-containing protein [Pirellulales bacterium]